MNAIPGYLRKIALGLVGLTAMSLVFYACCRDPYTRIFGMKGLYSSSDTYGHASDTVSTPFSITMEFNVGMASVSLPTLYAFQCYYKIINEVKLTTAQLYIDKPVSILGRMLPAGTNLLNHRDSRDYFQKQFDSHRRGSDGSLTIQLLPAIKEDWEWEAGWTTFTVSCSTPDGIEMSGSLSLYWAP